LRSMRATISWSYDALSTELQTLFRQLSVFSGGWNLQGAAAVCETTGTSMVDGLETLLDHHLAQREDTTAESRFSMFETVREFGRDQLTHGDDEDVCRRHAVYCVGFAHTAEPELAGAHQAAWLDHRLRDRSRQPNASGWAAHEQALIDGFVQRRSQNVATDLHASA